MSSTYTATTAMPHATMTESDLRSNNNHHYFVLCNSCFWCVSYLRHLPVPLGPLITGFLCHTPSKEITGRWESRCYLLAFLRFFGPAFAAAFFALAFPLPPPILNILVPQIEHVPDIALRPFFMVICFSPFISLFFLHFTQYACVTKVYQAKLK